MLLVSKFWIVFELFILFDIFLF